MWISGLLCTVAIVAYASLQGRAAEPQAAPQEMSLYVHWHETRDAIGGLRDVPRPNLCPE
jgi:hypothetical protein